MSKKLALLSVLVILVLLAGCGSPASPENQKPAETPGAVLKISPSFSEPISGEEQGRLEISAELKNDGNISLENVNAVFYNFGPNIIGCPEVFVGSLPQGETATVSCSLTPKARSQWGDPSQSVFTQTVALKVQYGFPISGAFENIRVLTPDEYSRIKPSSKSETKEVSIGPVTMKAEFKNQPAQAGRDFPVSLSFTVRSSDTEGIETVSGRQVAGAQLRIPPSFYFSSKGNFDRTGIPCDDGYICATKSGWDISGKNSSALTITIRPPALSVPEETYSARFDAEGFTVFKIAKKDITVNALSG